MQVLRRKFLGRLAEWICRWPWPFVWGGVALALAAGAYAALRLEFKTSRNDLIGRDSEYWRLYSEYAREFRAEEDYIVVVESDQPARNRTAVDALVAALLAPANNPAPGDHRAAQLFQPADVFYRVDLEPLQRWFLYYLSEAELRQIRDAVKDFKQLVAILQQEPRLDTFYGTMNRMLQQMESAPPAERRQMEAFLPTITAITAQLAEPPAEKWALLSSWASAFFNEDKLVAAEQEMRWQGYQVFRQGEMFIVLIHPEAANPGGEVTHDATIPKLRRILAATQAQFPDVAINLTGEPVLDYDEMRVSQVDATKATILTLIVIAVLFVFSFHEILRPLLALTGLVLALLMSLGFAALAVGHLNIITITFTVMILGLGIDLGIQFVARYEEELNRGASRPAAMATTLTQTGTSIITAGVTTAAAFFAMGLSGFRGVIELGVIAGGGMLIATAVTLLVLPALLVVVRRQTESTHIPAQKAATRFERLMLHRPYTMLGVLAGLTVASLLVGWQVRFNYNVLELQSERLPSVQTELRLTAADLESTLFAAVVCEDLEQTRRVHRDLSALPAVASVHSIAELIPEDQERKTGLLREIREHVGQVRFDIPPPDPVDGELLQRAQSALRLRAMKLLADARLRGDADSERALAPLVAALEQSRQRLLALEPNQRSATVAAYRRRFYADLEAQLNLMANQAEAPMEVADVPAQLRRMLVGKTGKFLVRVFAKNNIWEREPLVEFVREIQSVAPNATGTPLGLFEFVEILKRGYRNAGLWALLVIGIVIWVDFRRPLATGFTILPLLAGLAWLLGAMVMCDLRFNPANIMTLPLLVGIGTAYGIYVVQRYRETGDATFYGKSTGRAVVLSALTTIVGFASLLIGAHRGIRSLGLLMSLGVISCLIASLVLLPALLEIARRKGWKV